MTTVFDLATAVGGMILAVLIWSLIKIQDQHDRRIADLEDWFDRGDDPDEDAPQPEPDDAFEAAVDVAELGGVPEVHLYGSHWTKT